MQDKILSRMGDGERLWIPASELKKDIAKGTNDAAERGKVQALTNEEQPDCKRYRANATTRRQT